MENENEKRIMSAEEKAKIISRIYFLRSSVYKKMYGVFFELLFDIQRMQIFLDEKGIWDKYDFGRLYYQLQKIEEFRDETSQEVHKIENELNQFELKK